MTRRRWSVVLAALLLGLVLRVYHLGTSPRPNATADEYAWTWSGMTLVETGVPRAWSFLSAYPTAEKLPFQGQTFLIVKPWLDHPPLFPLVMGVWMRIGGYHDLVSVNLAYMRVVPLVCFCACLLIMAFVFQSLFTELETGIALFVFALAPPVVLQSKAVLSENFFVPLFLIGFGAVRSYLNEPRRKSLAVAVVCSILLPFTKVAALSLSFHYWVLASWRRDKRLMIAVVIGTLLGIALYVLWGAHYDFALFRAVMRAHSSRFIGFTGGFQLLFGLRIIDEFYLYPPFSLALLAILLDVKEGYARDFYSYVLAYVACMTFFVDHRSIYGWYWIPLYPAFCIGAARFIVRTLRDDSGLYLALWVVLALPHVATVIVAGHESWLQPARWMYLACVLFVPLAAFATVRRFAAFRAIALGVITLQLGSDLWFVLRS